MSGLNNEALKTTTMKSIKQLKLEGWKFFKSDDGRAYATHVLRDTPIFHDNMLKLRYYLNTIQVQYK